MDKTRSRVGANLSWLIAKNRTNPYEVQRATGVPQPTIHRILTGESSDPRTNTLQPLAAHFGVSVADLRERDLSGEGSGAQPAGTEASNVRFIRAVVPTEDDSRYLHVPKVSLRVAAGVTGFQIDPQAFDGASMTVDRKWAEQHGLNPEQLVWVQVRGRSMEKTLYENDWILIDLTSKEPRDSKIFVVNFGGEAVIKRLTRDLGRWWLTSDNPDPQYYRRECQGDDCIIVGQAILKHSEVL